MSSAVASCFVLGGGQCVNSLIEDNGGKNTRLINRLGIKITFKCAKIGAMDTSNHPTPPPASHMAAIWRPGRGEDIRRHVGDVRNGDFKAQEGAFPLLGSIWMHLDHYNEVSTLISGRDMFKQPLCLFNLGWKGNRIIHNSLTTLNTDNLKHCLHVWSYEYYE